MGTHALTVVKDNVGTLVTMYRHWDGYPDEHGRKLVEFLKPRTLVNGLPQDTTNLVNGMPDLAAQLVAHFKEGAGDIYLVPSEVDHTNEEWSYILTDRGCNPQGCMDLHIEVWNYDFLEFTGTVKEFATSTTIKKG